MTSMLKYLRLLVIALVTAAFVVATQTPTPAHSQIYIRPLDGQCERASRHGGFDWGRHWKLQDEKTWVHQIDVAGATLSRGWPKCLGTEI